MYVAPGVPTAASIGREPPRLSLEQRRRASPAGPVIEAARDLAFSRETLVDVLEASTHASEWHLLSITGPAGRDAVIRTVWIVNACETNPRIITAYPD